MVGTFNIGLCVYPDPNNAIYVKETKQISA